ncbi:MAG: hypothetical protein NT155_01825 [Candidatus Staskawiczbacteria bacterium]|nr:hypothetical protein [Candidatus Staskawiczbacteria bacterium]
MKTVYESFKVIGYSVHGVGVFSGGKQTSSLEVVVKVAVKAKGKKAIVVRGVADGKVLIEVIDIAMRNTLAPFFPAVASMSLVERRVHEEHSNGDVKSLARVRVAFFNGQLRCSGEECSENLIDASLGSVVKGLKKGLLYLSASAKS